MKVKEIMIGSVAFCAPETNAAAAAEIMWKRNCGLLPIVNAEGKVVGVVTDRDLFIALGTRNKLPGELTVGEVTSGKVYYCNPDDEVHTALSMMGREKIRRLLVIGRQGKLEGILSMDNVVTQAADRISGKLPELYYADVVTTLQHIYERPVPQLVHAQTVTA